jgi:hypothetical protein
VPAAPAPAPAAATVLADRARALLLTHEGRIVLAVVYSVAAVASIVTYTIMRSPLYGAGQLVVTGFGLLWARWCLRRV